MNAQALMPLLAHEVNRVEITLTDEELASMGHDSLHSYEALLQAAVDYGLTVETWRDDRRMCVRAVIYRPGIEETRHGR